MYRTRPWWRGLDRDVEEILLGWAPAAPLEALEERLRARLNTAEILRPEGCDLALAWDGVGGRREVRLLMERDLAHEADLARVLGRVLSQRAAGRTLFVVLCGGVRRTDLARELAMGLAEDDPVLDGAARVVDLRDQRSGSASAARTASG